MFSMFYVCVLFTDSPTTEHAKKAISNFITFNQSFKCLEALSSLVNSTPGALYRIPTTKYKIKKLIDPLFATQYHINCINCDKYSATTTNKVQCESCGVQLNKSTSQYFVYLPLTAQLKKCIEENFDDIISHRARFTESSDTITDVQDGIQFKAAQKNHPESIVLSLTVNTDGAKIFNSTSKSVWPIQICQNYLPPGKRYRPENVIVVGLHSGKPNMHKFFYPYLDEMKKLHDEGININRNGQTFNFVPVTTFFTGDIPAKAAVQCLNGHCGYFACGYCLHKGELIKKHSNSKAFVRYVKRASTIRTHNDMLEIYRKLNATPINGVKDVSCMIAADDFDMIHGFSIDYMHCVLLGILKKLLKLWLDKENFKQPYFIHNRRQVVLSKRILCVKPISEITRKPRSIFERNDFKANEYRSLLLYYLRFCLVGLLPIRYIDHFQLLSSAIFTLLQEKISQEDILTAEERLNVFADKFEDCYGKHNVTMNLHLLRHIANGVRHLGPLWAQSTFSFETNNGVLVKSNQATNDFLHCLAWRYTVKKSLDEKIEENDRETYVGGRSTIRINSEEISELNEIGCNIDSNILVIYRFINFGKTRITSLKSKEKTTADFFVQLRCGEIGIVEYYFAVEDSAYACISIYEIIDSIDHLKVVRPTDTRKIFSVDKIKCKLMYLKIEQHEIICKIPNRFEKT